MTLRLGISAVAAYLAYQQQGGGPVDVAKTWIAPAVVAAAVFLVLPSILGAGDTPKLSGHLESRDELEDCGCAA